jgi:hypothetical protein
MVRSGGYQAPKKGKEEGEKKRQEERNHRLKVKDSGAK